MENERNILKLKLNS